MKKIQFLLFIGVTGLFSACDKHDMLDEDLIVGRIAPQVYWEVKSTTVDAGSNVPFTAQYYTTGEAKLDRIEAWYNLVLQIDKTVSCPWITTSSYTLASSTSEEKRIDEKVETYPHQDSYWDDKLRAYTFTATFPTSVTLSVLSWVKPETFEASDLERIKEYFGAAFPEEFRSGLYEKMEPADFEKMFQGLNLVENFKTKYLEKVYNEFTGLDEYLFPKDDSGKRSVPQEVKNTFDAIPFSDLILNTSTSTYDVEYVRSYSINSFLKAIDANGNTGNSTKTEISLN